MGLEEVKSEILNEAEEEADSIVAEAKQEKQEIIEEAEQEALKIEENMEQELEEEKDSIRRQKLSNARMKSRQKELEAKQSTMEKVFEEFQERLESLDEEQREAFVDSCLDSADFEIGKVKVGEDFAEFVDDYDVEESDVNGFIAVSANGERQQAFTVEKIVQTFREDYRKQVADELFE